MFPKVILSSVLQLLMDSQFLKGYSKAKQELHLTWWLRDQTYQMLSDFALIQQSTYQ